MFLIKFGAASLPLYLIYYSNWNFRFLENSEAFLANLLLKAFQFETGLVKVISPDTGFKIPAIRIGKAIIGIDRPCTGYRSYFAFLGLVFATPNINRKRKIKGVIIGAFAIYLINILRIFITGVIGFYSPQSLDWVDGLLWGWGLIFVVLGLWLAWYKELGIIERLKSITS